MRIAVPTAGGRLCMHFGHCEEFLFVDVDDKAKTIIDKTGIAPPAHEPGNLPPWVGQQGADAVICGGMGARAKQLFERAGVCVITGAQELDPEKLVLDWMKGDLATGANACDENQPTHEPKCGE